MEERLYKVNVSSLPVRKDPKVSSNVYLERETVVKITGDQKQFKKEYWVWISLLTDPNVQGYVQLKYLSRIK